AHAAAAVMRHAVGLQGPGVEPWVDHDLPALRARGARVIASVWGRSTEEFGRAAKLLTPAREELVAVEVNINCPNLEDRSTMFAHSAAATGGATTAVLDADLDLPVFVKLSPNVSDLREIAGAALAAGATGLTLVNTPLGLVVDAEQRRPALGAGGGGLSGPAIKPVALRAVHDVARVHSGVPIIGAGGGAPAGVAARARRAHRLVRDARGHERRRPHRGNGRSPVTDVRDRLALALDVG